MDNMHQNVEVTPMAKATALFTGISTPEGAYTAGAAEGKTFANASERLRSAVMVAMDQPENIRDEFCRGLVDGLKSGGPTGKVYASVFNRIIANIKGGHLDNVKKTLSNPGGITEQVKSLPLGADGQPRKTRLSKATTATPNAIPGEQPKVGQSEKFVFSFGASYVDGKISYTSQFKKDGLLKDDLIGAAVEFLKLLKESASLSPRTMEAIYTAIAEEAIAVSDHFASLKAEQKAIEGESAPVEEVTEMHKEAA